MVFETLLGLTRAGFGPSSSFHWGLLFMGGLEEERIVIN
jgi:hypothetical protein